MSEYPPISHTWIPNAILQDRRFRSLPAPLRCAAIDIIGDLQMQGKDRLTVGPLRGEGLGRRGMEILAAVFLDAGWFERDEKGALLCSGPLAEYHATEVP
jgi:hypothetical protein